MSDKRVFTRGKVATLVGGPDWPTSVMMGLMGLPIAPMIAGTMPVICLVAPLSLSGSFMIQGTVAPFPALTNIALALSSLSQVGTFVAMLHFVEQASSTPSKREALEKMPYDLEVLELDRKSEEYQALYAELTAWHSKEVPRSMRILLWVGAISGICGCQFATLRGSNCWESFQLYPDFPTQLRDNLGGSISNLIMMPGYGVLGLILISYLCRAIFKCWAGRLCKRRYASGQRPKSFQPRQPVVGEEEEPSRSCSPDLVRRNDSSVQQQQQLAQQRQAQQMQNQQQQVPPPAAAAPPAGGRKLSAKSKPFWELQLEKEKAAEAAKLAQQGRSPAPLERSNSALGSSATKERPGREHGSSKKLNKEKSKKSSPGGSSKELELEA